MVVTPPSRDCYGAAWPQTIHMHLTPVTVDQEPPRNVIRHHMLLASPKTRYFDKIDMYVQFKYIFFGSLPTRS